ncbi:MAG: 50S ribosomal protein L11 methyltransferase [Clostridia bacterium]|nr:50S ribosomal protein L11 methyltransferase [Clostridia bacterium]
MKWMEVTVFTTEQGLDAVCGRLDMLGINQVMIEQGRDSIEQFLHDTAKYWDYADMDALVASEEPCVKAYIADVADNRATVKAIEESFEELRGMDVGIDLGSLNIVVRLTDDEDWENNWKIYYKPLEIGERLLVRPSWEQAEDTDRIVLSLDPGMAFGTGSHHTTRMCLEYLEKTVKDGDDMIDLGCGSGILSIGALLLGAKEALAVDIDPIAEKIAYENAAMNDITKDKYTVLIGDVLSDTALQEKLCEKQYDVVAANIVASVIIELTKIVPRMIKPDGRYIMSGIICERLDEVLAALDENGFEVLEVRAGDDWRAVMARPKR